MTENNTSSDHGPNTLPKYTFVGPNRFHPIIMDTVDYLETFKAPLPPETEKTPEQVAQLNAMQDAILTFGDDLGVDLRDRVVGQEDIHFFTPDQFELVREQFGRSRAEKGMALRTREVVVEDNGVSGDTLSVVNHELLHIFSHKEHSPTFEDTGVDVGPTKIGYRVARTQAFSILDEAVVEKANQYIKREYWPQYEALADSTEDDLGAYRYDVPVIDEVAKAISEKSGSSVDKVWKDMFKGLFHDDPQRFAPFYNVLGTEGMRALAGYKESTFDHQDRVITALGLDAIQFARGDNEQEPPTPSSLSSTS